MPTKPKIPCNHPGCPELVPAGEKYCAIHKPLHPQEVRSATIRGYDKKWQNASKRYLTAHPLCEICKKNGKCTKATVVDHIKPHRGNPELFWNPENWQALCKPCHDHKTGKEDRNVTYTY